MRQINQCDGCRRGLPVNDHGIHRAAGYDLIACTAHLYQPTAQQPMTEDQISTLGQSRLGSFVEAVVNVAIGFGINFTANLVVLPWFGFDITATDALGIGVVFTAISIARSYFIRRYFNKRIVAFARRMGERIE